MSRPNAQSLIAGLILSVTLTVQAFAATAKSDNVSVDLPEAKLEGTSKVAPDQTASPSWLEVGFSTWQPSNFSLPANFGSTVAFSRASVPSVSLNYLRTEGSSLHLLLGANFLAMDRTAPADFGGGLTSDTQTIDLLSIRAGLEYSPASLADDFAQPYFSAALLPTFGLTGRSAFDDGTVYFGIPLEFALGARVAMKRLGISWEGAALEINAAATVGTVDYSSFEGYGFGAGIRVSL